MNRNPARPGAHGVKLAGMLEHLDELRIADVATFLAVARSGSVTMAARQLDVTPSQVSKAVARLEGYLKVRLIERSGRGIILTDAAGYEGDMFVVPCITPTADGSDGTGAGG